MSEQADRELLATVIMEWHREQTFQGEYWCGEGTPVQARCNDWHPESDTEQAMQVAMRLTELERDVEIKLAAGGHLSSCCVLPAGAPEGWRSIYPTYYADNLPQAIYAAAVEVAKAMKGEES